MMEPVQGGAAASFAAQRGRAPAQSYSDIAKGDPEAAAASGAAEARRDRSATSDRGVPADVAKGRTRARGLTGEKQGKSQMEGEADAEKGGRKEKRARAKKSKRRETAEAARKAEEQQTVFAALAKAYRLNNKLEIPTVELEADEKNPAPAVEESRAPPISEPVPIVLEALAAAAKGVSGVVDLLDHRAVELATVHTAHIEWTVRFFYGERRGDASNIPLQGKQERAWRLALALVAYEWGPREALQAAAAAVLRAIGAQPVTQRQPFAADAVSATAKIAETESRRQFYMSKLHEANASLHPDEEYDLAFDWRDAVPLGAEPENISEWRSRQREEARAQREAYVQELRRFVAPKQYLAPKVEVVVDSAAVPSGAATPQLVASAGSSLVAIELAPETLPLPLERADDSAPSSQLASPANANSKDSPLESPHDLPIVAHERAANGKQDAEQTKEKKKKKKHKESKEKRENERLDQIDSRRPQQQVDARKEQQSINAEARGTGLGDAKPISEDSDAVAEAKIAEEREGSQQDMLKQAHTRENEDQGRGQLEKVEENLKSKVKVKSKSKGRGEARGGKGKERSNRKPKAGLDKDNASQEVGSHEIKSAELGDQAAMPTSHLGNGSSATQ